ncbi:MAG TPA: BolA family protein [Methylophilaceae bacterium]|nr:BolA family protein [Methylophilaceae bacterium]
MTITDEIRTRLAPLEPVLIDIQDDSAKHVGHAGNTGGGHYTLTIVSSQFCGKSQIIRHRFVYDALEGLIPGRIHALSIQAIATDEPYRP